MIPKRRILVFINPHSGKGKGEQLFERDVLPYLRKHDDKIQFESIVTGHAFHAHEIVRDLDLSKWSEICIVSGDGLVFEVINGLLGHKDPEKAMGMPISHYPGGSGNAVAAGVAVANGYSARKPSALRHSSLSSIVSTSHRPFNVMYVETKSFNSASILGVGWAFLADCDFNCYKARLSFLRANDVELQGKESITVCTRSSDENQNGTNGICHQSDNSVQSRLKSRLSVHLPGLNDPVPENWEVIEDKFAIFYVLLSSHLASDIIMVPQSEAMRCSDYFFIVMMRSHVSRLTLAKWLIKLENEGASSYFDDNLEVIPARAFRLEPLGRRKSILTADGELIERSEAIQGCLTDWRVSVKCPELNSPVEHF